MKGQRSHCFSLLQLFIRYCNQGDRLYDKAFSSGAGFSMYCTFSVTDLMFTRHSISLYFPWNDSNSCLVPQGIIALSQKHRKPANHLPPAFVLLYSMHGKFVARNYTFVHFFKGAS